MKPLSSRERLERALIADEPTRAGSKVLADEAQPATADAPVVRRLRAGGAVIVAKTNMTEFALGAIALWGRREGSTRILAPGRTCNNGGDQTQPLSSRMASCQIISVPASLSLRQGMAAKFSPP
jgi:Amidase